MQVQPTNLYYYSPETYEYSGIILCTNLIICLLEEIIFSEFSLCLVTFLQIWFAQDGHSTQHQDIIMTTILDFTMIQTMVSIILIV